MTKNVIYRSHQHAKNKKKTILPVDAYINFAISHVRSRSVRPLSSGSYNAGPDMSMANAAVGLTRRPAGSPAGTVSQMPKFPFKMQSSRAAKSSASTCKVCVRCFTWQAMHYDCKTKDITSTFSGFSFQSTMTMRSSTS